jgi:hypothetical protein
MKTQILEFTEAFPPAHKLTEIVLNVDYHKHYNSFIDGVENVIVIIAAIVTVLYQKWNDHCMTERLQLVTLRVKEFTLNVAAPKVYQAAVDTYQAGRQVREIYTLITSDLFVTV